MKVQPKLDIPKTRLEMFLDIFALLFFIAALLYLFFHLGSLPDQVPGHYNAAGEADRWGSKAELFLLPVVAAGLWGLLTVMEKHPHMYNYLNLREENLEAQYRNGRLMMNVLKNECTLVFSYLIFQTIRVAIGEADGLGAAFLPVSLIVIFGSTFLFLIRMLRL